MLEEIERNDFETWNFVNIRALNKIDSIKLRLMPEVRSEIDARLKLQDCSILMKSALSQGGDSKAPDGRNLTGGLFREKFAELNSHKRVLTGEDLNVLFRLEGIDVGAAFVRLQIAALRGLDIGGGGLVQIFQKGTSEAKEGAVLERIIRDMGGGQNNKKAVELAMRYAWATFETSLWNNDLLGVDPVAEIFYLKAYRLGEAQAGKDRGPDATLLEVEGVGSSFSRMAVDERNNPLIVVDNAGGSPRDQYYDRMQATRNAVNRIFVVDPRGVDFTKMSPNGYGLYISARIPQMLKVKELLLKDDWSPKDVSLDAIRSWLSPFDFVDRNELLHLRYWLVTGIIDSAFRTRGRTIELGWSRNSLNTFRRNITSDLGAGGERVVRFISVDDLNRLLKWSNAELKALNASGARAAGFGGGKDGGR